MKAKLNKTVTIYTLLMLIVFPLFMVHTYYDIQTVKMYFYQISTLVCGAVTALTALIYIARDKSLRRSIAEGLRPAKLKARLKAADIFVLIFLFAVLVSTFSSEWIYEAFWGNVARYMGGYMMLLFVLSYFLITRFYVPDRRHMDLALLAGMILCAWGVLDYFSLSPVGFGYETLFSSTIGNIDVLTSIEVMYVGAASVMYISERPADKQSRRRSIYYLLASFVCFMGLECGRTANLLLSLTFLICFMPFYAFGSARGILRYIELLITFCAAMLVTAGLTAAFPDYACSPEYMGELDKLGNMHPELTAAALIGLAALRAVIGLLLKPIITAENAEKERKLALRLRIIWGALGFAALICVIYVFWDANHGGHPELYAPAANLLIFNGAWGTNRGYVWSLAMKYYESFSWFEKLFGSGPETFAIYVMKYDLNSTLSFLDASYDSIHNEWLQHLFELGIAGCVGFYGMLASAMVTGLRSGKCRAALCFAVMAYLVQSFVNISVPLVLPFVIVCAAVAAGNNSLEHSRK